MVSSRFDLHVDEEAEDQGLPAGTEHPIPRAEVAQGVGIESEAVRSDPNLDGTAEADGAGIAVSVAVAVDQRVLNRRPLQDSPPSQ